MTAMRHQNRRTVGTPPLGTTPSDAPRFAATLGLTATHGLAAAICLAAFLGLGSAGCEATYDDHDLKLLTRYRAKELCSCLFVMEQTEAYCDRWTLQPPDVATYTIDRERREVRTQAMMFWAAKARFTDDHFGCRLVD